MKLRNNPIDKPATDYDMIKNKAISAVANTIKQLHIQKNMYMKYKHDFYENKVKEIDDLFLEYLVPVMEYIEHPELIE